MSAETKPMPPLGVGIIGAGGVLERNALAYISLPELARPVAIADIDRSRAEEARSFYGFEAAYRDYQELLDRKDVDVVSVLTRPNLHPRVVIDAIRAGKHVLCEKPIAHTLAGADEIIAACAEQPQTRVCCLYQWRSDPVFRLFRRLVEERRLGRPVMADVHLRSWRPDSYYAGAARRESWDLDGGGVVMVIAIHQVDMLVAILGDPVEVSARMDTTSKPSEAEDTLVGWLRFDSGALATLRASVCEQDGTFSMEILGERARVSLKGGGPINNLQWDLASIDPTARRLIADLGAKMVPRRGRGPGELAVRILQRVNRLRGRPWLPPRHWWHTPFVREYLEAIQSGAPTPVPPEEARRSLEAVTALYQSALTGSPVTLPLGKDSPLYAGVDSTRWSVTTKEVS